MKQHTACAKRARGSVAGPRGDGKRGGRGECVDVGGGKSTRVKLKV